MFIIVMKLFKIYRLSFKLYVLIYFNRMMVTFEDEEQKEKQQQQNV